MKYPPAPTSAQSDDYHGTTVADPYRPLEDPDAAETQAWIAAQNALTQQFLKGVPSRESIRSRLTQLWDYPRRWAPVKRGERYFQLRNTGLQNQDSLYVMDALDGEGTLLLDPNTLSDDGTMALNIWEPSPDGNWLAYASSGSGSDWQTWRVRSTQMGEDLPDTISWSKFSGAAWLKDSSGFYYSRYDAPLPGQDYTSVNYFQKLYFHRLDQSQDQDSLVYERPDHKEWGFGAEVSDDGCYLVINVWEGTDVRNRLFYQELAAGGPVVELIPELEASFTFIGNDGPVFYLLTDLDAPQRRVIALDITHPGRESWRTVIAESGDTLENAWLVHDEFIGLYLHDAYNQLRRFSRKGHVLGEILLPGIGSIPANGNFFNLTGRRQDAELFFGFWSFVYPVRIYRYDFIQERAELLFAPPLPYDPDQFITRQVFVDRPDGARVPMFLTHKKDLVPAEQNPTLLYGYGGFNLALKPLFHSAYLAWVEMGGVLAFANLRGGSEYGEAWHQAGMLQRKQTVFDDFIACAEWLIQAGITSTPRLAIYGRSNGGLLAGACLTQRPDLFGAALPAVGVMDMLRFHRFTIGWAWVSEYGSADDPEMYPVLAAYSPLHNIRPGTRYPPTLVTTADHDDRVVPGHSFKFAAALQAAQAGPAPVLIRIDQKAGHGVGKPTAKQIAEWTDLWAFLVSALQFQPSLA